MTAPNLPPGHVVAAKYSVQALLGYGGSTATYRVIDAHRRDLAMKLFDPAIAQRADVMSAIERLYGSINGLPPEMIFQILDAGYDPATGAPFCITELCTNPSLAQMTAQRPLGQQEVLSVLQSMARVLDTAHSRQVMHHALKPTNVFVSPPQGFAVRVSDFGAGLPRSIVPTQEGYSLSAPWMAPEQLQGNAPPGPAADVFAAGLVTFFALTGRSYWRSCQGGAPDLAGWQREIMSPRMPVSARAAELGIPLHPMLDSILGRALAADPAERFRSVGEFASAFATCTSAPEAAPTMAFPSMSMPDMPSASPAASSGGDGGYPPAPAPAGDAGMGGRSMPTHLVKRVPEAPSSSKLVPILVGVGAVVLIGGGALAWILLGKKPEPAGPIAIVPAQSSAQAGPNAAASAPAPTSPPPEATAAVAPAAGSAAAAPVLSELAITCSTVPCDEIQIDDKPVDVANVPSQAAGQHKIKVSKAGFVGQTESITVELGKKFEKDYKLIPIPKQTSPGPVGTQPSTGSGGQPTKKCGTKFIPCK